MRTSKKSVPPSITTLRRTHFSANGRTVLTTWTFESPTVQWNFSRTLTHHRFALFQRLLLGSLPLFIVSILL